MTTIFVTQEDIEKGVPCMKTSCPIALAIARVLKVHSDVRVTPDVIGVEDLSFGVTLNISSFISRFDAGWTDRKPTPFSFELDIPEEYLRSKV